ncbi:MAG: flagellar motor protein MotD [Pseudomonadota bacterium]
MTPTHKTKMTRRRRRNFEERENPDRWLVSYADFITLLFASFVVMYAVSSVNEGRYRAMSDSLSYAFGYLHKERVPTIQERPAVRVIPSIIPPTGALPKKDPDAEKQKQEVLKMQDLAERILRVLAPLVKDGQVHVTRTRRGVSVEINASVLFAPAHATIQPESTTGLKAIATVLAGVDELIQVEGHTDDIPISTPQFPSNWELSSARAGSVVRFFVANGVASTRLTAAGYADNRPVTADSTPDGRARNRRVTLLLLPVTPASEEQ